MTNTPAVSIRSSIAFAVVVSVASALLAGCLGGGGGGGGSHSSTTSSTSTPSGIEVSIDGVNFDTGTSADLTRTNFMFSSAATSKLYADDDPTDPSYSSAWDALAGQTITISFGIASVAGIPCRTMAWDWYFPSTNTTTRRVYYIACDSSATPSVWILKQTGTATDFTVTTANDVVMPRMLSYFFVHPADPSDYFTTWTDGYVPFGEGSGTRDSAEVPGGTSPAYTEASAGTNGTADPSNDGTSIQWEVGGVFTSFGFTLGSNGVWAKFTPTPVGGG